MSSIEEKLAGFSNIVLAEAERKKEKMVKETQQKRNEEVVSKESEYLENAYEEIQRTVSKCSKENNERVLKFEMKLKKELLLRREEIIDEVFIEVKNKINDFVESDKYKEWLETRVLNACREVGEGRKNVFVTERDLTYKKELESKIDMIEVFKAEQDDFLGGAMICNVDKKIVADYTIKQMLEEQRSTFLQISGLTIN